MARKGAGELQSYPATQADMGEEKRETWGHKIDFLLACIGFSVGLGNVWRFPYLCYKNGGGAFLIPYFICVVVGGIPLFFLEVAVGQFMSESGVNAWRLVPIFQGIGWTTTIVVFFLNCYYNVILAWAFYYLFASFTSRLPWDNCDNYWNTEACTLDFGQNETAENSSMYGITSNATCVLKVDPTTEFWENKVLGISESEGIHDMVNIKWDLALCLLLAWILVYFCIWKGIKTSGKVMYFTATSPYILMIVLLVRGCTLDGAVQGILYYIVPDFERLKDMTVWVDAGTQIFFSYSIGLGALTALGSYNKFNHNSYRDSVIFAVTNSGTSFLAGFVIFSVLGHMAHIQGVPVSEVAGSGPGLAFIAYPKAVSLLPVSPLWSILFFIMLILLGIDSQMVGVEGLITSFTDTFPVLRKPIWREIFIGVACILQFLVGLSMVTNGGMYVFQLFDYYTGSRIILLVGFFECFAIAGIYGINRFSDNVEMMLGTHFDPYMKISWVFTAPVFCLAVFVMSGIQYSALTYKRPNQPLYDYPQWSVGVGWLLAAVSIICIPIFAIYKTIQFVVIERKGFRALFQPQGLKEHQLRPEDKIGEFDHFDDIKDHSYPEVPGEDNPAYYRTTHM